MKKAVPEDTLDESCKKLEQTLGDVDSQEMILEVRAAVHVFKITSLQGEPPGALWKFKHCLVFIVDIVYHCCIRREKLLHSEADYSRPVSTMSQERLNDLAMISTEQSQKIPEHEGNNQAFY